MTTITVTSKDILSWNDKFEWGRSTIINNEIQHYLEQNEKNSNINYQNDLEMRAIRELTTLDGITQQYSSSVFISKDRVHVKAGDTVTIRAKMADFQEGIFAAFWLLRTDAVWQKTEIDVFETTAQIFEGKYHAAHHSHVNADKTYQKFAGSIPAGVDLINEYHDYGVRLFETYFEFLFDGEVVKTVEFHEHEYDLEYYLLLNVAVAPGDGHWAGGSVESGWNGSTYDGWTEAGIDVSHIEIISGDATNESQEDTEDYSDLMETPNNSSAGNAELLLEISDLENKISDLKSQVSGISQELNSANNKLKEKDQIIAVFRSDAIEDDDLIRSLNDQLKLKDSDEMVKDKIRKSSPPSKLFYKLAKLFGGKV